MQSVLVDSNVILDLFTEDRLWFDWSADQLETLARSHTLIINPIIYSEISYRFSRREALDAVMEKGNFRRDPLPYEAAFLAAKCHAHYRSRGGTRERTLPDFYIGAHAAVGNMTLLTRDNGHYQTYFPDVKLIAPR